MFRSILCFFLVFSCLAFAGCGQQPSPSEKEYERIVVISDLHYPSKTVDAAKRQAIIDNKVKARDEINGWSDVDLKVFPGDMVEMQGSMKQMEEAKQFIDGFTGEKAYLAGNHELFYKEELKNGKPVMADPALRKAHEENYEKVFGPLHSTKKLGQYLLIFLSPEDTEGKFPVAMSKEEMEWLRKTLKENSQTPTLIFYHARLLDKLDYQMIARHPKMLIGFSDITALHAAIGQRSGIVTIHGPMMSTFKGDNYTAFTLYNFENGLSGSLPKGEIRLPAGKSLKALSPGDATGLVEGGNLTVISSLCGTPYELKGDGAILLLEDTGEDPYRVDRMMEQLYQNGLLSRVSAIAYGDFYGASPVGEEFSIHDVLAHYAKLSGKPVIEGVPVGHGPDNLFLPLGVKATIHAGEDGSASFSYDESYLK